MIPTSYESCIRDLHAMMDFVLRLQTTENRDRAFDCGLVDGHRLEPPFERGVFSNRFAVLVRCRTFKQGMVGVLVTSEGLRVQIGCQDASRQSREEKYFWE